MIIKENIYSKILGIDEKIRKSFYSTKFNDNKLESDFNKFIVDINFIFKIYIQLVYFVLMFIRIFTAKINQVIVYKISNIILLGIWLIFQIAYYSIKNLIFKKYIEICISFLFIFIQMFNTILTNFLIKEVDNAFNYRAIYVMILYTMTDILYLTEFNFILTSILFLMNTITCIVLAIIIDDKTNRYLDAIICFFMLTTVIYFKVRNSLLIRENFFQNYKFRRYFSYCYDLINSMNGFQFTKNNKKILIYNESFQNHLIKTFRIAF